MLTHAFQGGSECLEIGDVHLIRARGRQLSTNALGVDTIEVENGEAGAFLGHAAGDRLAQASAATGDDRDASIESHRCAHLLVLVTRS